MSDDDITKTRAYKCLNILGNHRYIKMLRNEHIVFERSDIYPEMNLIRLSQKCFVISNKLASQRPYFRDYRGNGQWVTIPCTGYPVPTEQRLLPQTYRTLWAHYPNAGQSLRTSQSARRPDLRGRIRTRQDASWWISHSKTGRRRKTDNEHASAPGPQVSPFSEDGCKCYPHTDAYCIVYSSAFPQSQKDHPMDQKIRLPQTANLLAQLGISRYASAHSAEPNRASPRKHGNGDYAWGMNSTEQARYAAMRLEKDRQ